MAKDSKKPVVDLVLSSARLALAITRRRSGSRRSPKAMTLLLGKLMNPWLKGFLLCVSKEEEVSYASLYQEIYTKKFKRTLDD